MEIIVVYVCTCVNLTVSNGPKEQLGVGEGAGGSEDFESWRSQQQQQPGTASHNAYGATAPITSTTDLYGMSTAAGNYRMSYPLKTLNLKTIFFIPYCQYICIMQ